MCSPRLSLRQPRDLHEHMLLHSEWRHPTADTPTWRLWRERASLAELAGLDVDAGLRFTDESHAIQAAIAGHGVALLSLALVADDLASGALVQPFGPALDGYPHWFVRAPGVEPAGLAALRDWLRAQAAAGSADAI